MSYAVYILVPDVSKSRNLRNVGNKITMQRYNLFNPAVFVFLRDSPPVGQDLLIHEVSRSHTRRTTVCRTPLDE